MKVCNWRYAVMLIVLPLAGCPVGNVREDDPYALRVRELEQKVEQMQRVLENQSLVQLLSKLEELQNEVRALRGEVETLRYDVDSVRERQRDTYLDLDHRLQSLENATGGAPAQAASGAPSDRDAYQNAFGMLREARYGEAKQAFRSFIDTYPQSSLLPNAWYWLGEINYVNKLFEEARGQFSTVVEKYPDANKAPDAWLKLGYCYYELQNWPKAREVLQALRNRFPEHPAAKLAQERLARMQQEKH